MALVKIGDEVCEVCAFWVGEVEGDFEDALGAEVGGDEADVVGVVGVEEVMGCEMGYGRRQSS